MPALLEVRLLTGLPRPAGLLGVPLHGMVFEALERQSTGLSTRIHEAALKPFRIGQSRWLSPEETGTDWAEITFQLGLLDDTLLETFLTALQPKERFGSVEATLQVEVQGVHVLRQESYADLYSRHASDVLGRTLHFELLTPTTFRTTDMDMPFPVPKTVFYGLQRRWEHFSDLHFGELNEWVGRAVRVRDYRLRPRSVHFKGARGASMTASIGEVTYEIARPGDFEPKFVRLLADYANFAGLGYKTAYGLGHVETSGWRNSSDVKD